MIRSNAHGVLTIPLFQVGVPEFSAYLLKQLYYRPQDVLS